MRLEELAREYRESGLLCRQRAAEVELALEEPMTETQRLRQRRRLAQLRTMARDAIAIANYLSRYYT